MNRRSAWMAMFMTVLLLAGCGGGGGGSSSGGGGIGTLSVSLADATTDRFSAVYITITEVQVHQPGTSEGDQRNWRPVRMPRTPMTVNLLDLVNGVLEELGNVQLAAGTYTQMRLIIGAAPEPGAVNILNQPHPYANYVMDRSTPPNSYELKVPSGSQSGYKVVGGFDIIANSTTELILDFDADRSVVEAGNSGQWLLKPTVKIVYDYAIIEGLVTTTSGSTSTPLPGVRVSAQMFDGSQDPGEQVTVEAATSTDDSGRYQMFVRPGSYNLVAYKSGYAPQIADVAAVSGGLIREDFTLSATGMGTVTGSVIITGNDPERYATLSFQQTIGAEEIEVYSINIGETNLYSVRLPAGTYTVVATSYWSADTYTRSVSVTANTPTGGVNIVL